MKLNGKSASRWLAREIKIKSPKTDLNDEQQPCDDEGEQMRTRKLRKRMRRTTKRRKRRKTKENRKKMKSLAFTEL